MINLNNFAFNTKEELDNFSKITDLDCSGFSCDELVEFIRNNNNKYLFLKKAKLTVADLQDATLTVADLQDADLRFADLQNVKYNANTIFPAGFVILDSMVLIK